MAKSITIGSYGSGSLLDADVTSAYLDIYIHVVPEDDRDAGLVKEAQDIVSGAGDDTGDSDAAQWVIEALYDAANNALPAYLQAGTHEGDGADFGIWPCMDQIEEDRQSGELHSIDTISEHVPSNAIEVNDHGNVTMYQWDAESMSYVVAWDCV